MAEFDGILTFWLWLGADLDRETTDWKKISEKAVAMPLMPVHIGGAILLKHVRGISWLKLTRQERLVTWLCGPSGNAPADKRSLLSIQPSLCLFAFK